MKMIFNTCYIASILSFIALLDSIGRVLYSKGVICQIWVLLRSDPSFRVPPTELRVCPRLQLTHDVRLNDVRLLTIPSIPAAAVTGARPGTP